MYVIAKLRYVVDPDVRKNSELYKIYEPPFWSYSGIHRICQIWSFLSALEFIFHTITQNYEFLRPNGTRHFRRWDFMSLLGMSPRADFDSFCHMWPPSEANVTFLAQNQSKASSTWILKNPFNSLEPHTYAFSRIKLRALPSDSFWRVLLRTPLNLIPLIPNGIPNLFSIYTFLPNKLELKIEKRMIKSNLLFWSKKYWWSKNISTHASFWENLILIKKV